MKNRATKYFWLAGLAVAVTAAVAITQTRIHSDGQRAEAAPAHGNGKSETAQPRSAARVTVTKPHKGGIPRTSNQPGTIEAFDFADLYAKVSGYLDKQPVDIGDRVEKGDVLAELDVPELLEEVEHAKAALAQAEAQVVQMEARVDTAVADYDAATANIALSEADLGKSVSMLSFRNKQYERMKELFRLKSVDERLVDEKEEQRDAAEAQERASRAAISTAKAQAAASKARIAQAKADVVDAKAKVDLAKANLAKAKVFVGYTRIISPYDGVVTRRSFHTGAFIRAADQGGNVPLLTVARTDLMRVVVQIPERDVPFTDKGDPALVEVDALPGQKLKGTVSRIASSEDRVTRSMRTEVDLPNTDRKLRDGMFGRITVFLDTGVKGMTVPSACLVGDPKSKRFGVFLARDGKAQLKQVEVGHDDGIQVEILSGLAEDDQVIVRPGGNLTNGTPVEVETAELADDRPAGRH